jgi:hypothetical protein
MSDFPLHPDREDEQFDMSVSQVWVRRRISCPHRDILRAYLAGGLREGERDYIRFHLDVIECPFCHANLEDLEVMTGAEKEELKMRVQSAVGRTRDSSIVLLQELRDSMTDS